MNVNGKHYRTIWVKPSDQKIIQIIDQRQLPFDFVIEDLKTVEDVVVSIKDMHVRGAGLIGVAAAYGMYIAALEAPKNDFDNFLKKSAEKLKATRPTAVNLMWAVNQQLEEISKGKTIEEKIKISKETADKIADEDTENCRKIGQNGLKIIEEISKKKKGQVVNILTHCNAGWLAFVDYGSALAPVYAAFEKGIKLHVWVDETRPRNQGARLTAWELGQHGVPHTIIPDNVGGHLMQHGLVDMVIVGSDRTTYTGYVANKIGTYLKALAAKDNNVPFYAALPSSTIDWKMQDGIKEIPIEQRGSEEVKYIQGKLGDKVVEILITPEKSNTANYGFDVTPPKLITGIITERGILEPNKESFFKLYPEQKPSEGYTKFSVECVSCNKISENISDINKCRDKLYSLKYLGSHNGRIGFGNLSFRVGTSNEFVITGSATGCKSSVCCEDYAKVIDFDVNKNYVKYEGCIIPSSETIIHGSIYQVDSNVKAIIHIHNPDLWKKLVETEPKIIVAGEYGSPELANNIKSLLENKYVRDKKIIIMKDHFGEGILVFGASFEKTMNTLLNMVNR